MQWKTGKRKAPLLILFWSREVLQDVKSNIICGIHDQEVTGSSKVITIQINIKWSHCYIYFIIKWILENAYQIKSLQWQQKVGCLKNLGMNLWSLTSEMFFFLRAPFLALSLEVSTTSSPGPGLTAASGSQLCVIPPVTVQPLQQGEYTVDKTCSKHNCVFETFGTDSCQIQFSLLVHCISLLFRFQILGDVTFVNLSHF